MRKTLLVIALAASACATQPSMEAPNSLAAAETAFAAHSVRAGHARGLPRRLRRRRSVRPQGLDGFERLPASPAGAEDRARLAPAVRGGRRLGRASACRRAVEDHEQDRSQGGSGLRPVRLDLAAPAPVPGRSVDLGSRIPALAGKRRSRRAPLRHERTGSGASPSRVTLRARFAGAGAPRPTRPGRKDLRYYRNGQEPAASRATASLARHDRRAPCVDHPDEVEVLASGDLAHSSGPVRNPKGELTARFNSVWRREADAWRIVLDVANPAT